MIKASRKPTAHIDLRDRVAAHFDALADAADCECGRRNPEVVKLDLVTEGFGPLQQLGVGGSAQGAFESEGDAGFDAVMDFTEQELACLNGEFLRIERREAGAISSALRKRGMGSSWRR